MAAFCAQCGTQLTEGARFCPSCGTAVERSPDAETGASSRAVQSPSRSRSPWKVALLVIGWILAGGMAFGVLSVFSYVVQRNQQPDGGSYAFLFVTGLLIVGLAALSIRR